MRISDWSSYVCSSDLIFTIYPRQEAECPRNWVRLKLPRYGSLAALSTHPAIPLQDQFTLVKELAHRQSHLRFALYPLDVEILGVLVRPVIGVHRLAKRSEEHTSELQSLMRLSYAVFCLNKKQTNKEKTDLP